MKYRNLYSFIFLFLFLTLNARAYTQDALKTKVTLNVKATPLLKVFKILEKEADVKFAYSNENIRPDYKVTCYVKEQPLADVLNKLIQNLDLGFDVIGNMIALHKVSIISNANGTKDITPDINNSLIAIMVSGTVIDETGSPMPGVTIKIKGTMQATLTDANGRFAINAPSGDAILIFSFVGYSPQEIAINGRKNITVNMAPDSKTLNDVIVVGYGTQKREKVIGSIAQINAKQIEDRPVTQLQNALTGQLAGVTVTQRNGRPGFSSGTISVRGVGSFGATPDALILVDGIPVDNFNEIDPNDVESISVLKDASSAAIYGSRAANGVILVTTKTGKAGKTQISYSGYAGFQKPTALAKFVNSWEYEQALFEASNATSSATGDATLTPDQQAAVAKYRAQNDPNFPNTDFIDAVITEHGIQTGHNIAISGGSENNKYNLSLGYLNQGGLVKNDNYSKYNVRLNLTTTLSPKLELSTRLSTIVGTIHEPASPAQVNFVSVTAIIGEAIRYPAFYVAQYPNGDYGQGINVVGTPVSALATPSFDNNRNINLSGNTKLDYKAFRGFKASLIASYVQATGRETLFRSTERLNSTFTLGPNTLTESTDNNYYYTVQGLVEYNKQFGKSQINFLGGYSFEKNTAENFNAFRDNLPGNNLYVLEVGSPGNQQATGTGTVYALESQFARANYAYDNKYLLEGVIRRDGSSKFPTDNKYAYFPSVAIGWRIGQESFIKDNLPWINELKLKASIGVLGNQGLPGNYPYQNTLITSSSNIGGTLYSFGGTIAQGVTRNTITDEDLHWESTRTTDVGLEATLFKNTLNFSVTYFDRYTYDILYPPTSSVSHVLGFTLGPQNTGKLTNKGLEITLGYNNKVGKFSYNINGNITFLKNKVLDLGVGNITQLNGLVGNGNNLFIGYPNSNANYDLYYGLTADGLYVDQADVTAYTAKANQTAINPNPKPGDIRYKDISGPNGVPDGKVDNTYDRTVIGSQIPKYSYGINLGAQYMGFDISTLLQGIGGVSGYLNGASGYALYNSGSVQRWQYDERWTAQNPNPNAAYPRIESISNSGTPNTAVSTFWVINGAYLRVKNVQVGYTLPKLLTDKIKVAKIRMYLSGENLLTFSHYRPGWDPEINGALAYPLISNFTLGFNVTF